MQGGEPPLAHRALSESFSKLFARAVVGRPLHRSAGKFSPAFYKRLWGEGAKPFPAFAKAGILLYDVRREAELTKVQITARLRGPARVAPALAHFPMGPPRLVERGGARGAHQRGI